MTNKFNIEGYVYPRYNLLEFTKMKKFITNHEKIKMGSYRKFYDKKTNKEFEPDKYSLRNRLVLLPKKENEKTYTKGLLEIDNANLLIEKNLYTDIHSSYETATSEFILVDLINEIIDDNTGSLDDHWGEQCTFDIVYDKDNPKFVQTLDALFEIVHSITNETYEDLNIISQIDLHPVNISDDEIEFGLEITQNPWDPDTFWSDSKKKDILFYLNGYNSTTDQNQQLHINGEFKNLNIYANDDQININLNDKHPLLSAFFKILCDHPEIINNLKQIKNGYIFNNFYYKSVDALIDDILKSITK